MQALSPLENDITRIETVLRLVRETLGVTHVGIELRPGHESWMLATQGVCPAEPTDDLVEHVLTTGEILLVEDLSRDQRVGHSAVLDGLSGVRSYAGTPIMPAVGETVGVLSVMDAAPRRFTSQDVVQLGRMAELLAALIRQRRDSTAVQRLTGELLAQIDINRDQAEALTRFKRVVEGASALARCGAWEWNVKTDRLVWTDGMYDIYELPRGSPLSRTELQGFHSSSSRKQLETLFAVAPKENRGFTMVDEILTAKGNARWLRLSFDVECQDGVTVRCFGMVQDITEQKVVWSRMRDLAERDSLTGLANRSLFQAKLSGLADRTSETGVTLLLIDLDGFKHINDTFGHSAGDACLTLLGRRLSRMCRNAEVVARLGGDEFAVLWTLRLDDASVLGRAARLMRVLQRPIRWQGQSFYMGGSMGLAVSDHRPGMPLPPLLAQADLALYAAKADGRGMIRLFTPEMKASADARHATVRAINTALAERRLELFYQPKIALVDQSLAGFEVLLRWRKPDGQIVPACDFAAALEDPELSGRIGAWVIEQSLCQAQQWHDMGLDFGRLAINLSSSQFYESDFVSRFVKRIADHGLSATMFELEVTEGVFLSQEPGTIRRVLATLREAGVSIALDDFGTGFASLTHLRVYQVDVIKIDRSFVQHFLTSKKDHAILQATLFLARHLGLDVVAEGIEEPDQSEFLKALGCRYGQGYLFSKAIPAAEAATWCRPAPGRAKVA